LSEVRRLLALVQFLGAPSRGEYLELPIRSHERAAFNELRTAWGLQPAPYVCVHPGARLASRRWPAERFARVADALAQRGYRVVITGTGGETHIGEAVRRQTRSPALDLCGRTTTLGALAALVEGAQLVVCNDTGISHVAAATRTPSIVVCNGADPQRWQPLDTARHRVLWHAVACRPCAHDECPTAHECAHGVTVERVVAEALQLLDAHDPQPHVQAAA
jgi:ADP-heptose:LPS heptosyltransferase